MKKLRIGLAGLGVVGEGVYEILKKDAKLLEARSGTSFEVVAVSSRSKKDFVDSKIKVYANAVDLASDAEVDVIVEVIGGNTVAKELIEKAIKNGKKVVTANKALLAEHGFDLAKLSEEKESHIAFEASVAGATPVIKIFKEGLAANNITEFYAILNGTCNFILTKMKEENLDFPEALKQAQDLGFAESDPTFDIKGIDAAHKLTILASIASQTKPDFKHVYVEGIDEVSGEDIKLADDLGYKIKLLGIYKNLGSEVQKTVYPALIKASEKIAQVDSSFNTILSKGSNAGWSIIIGSGAGRFPTASAIVADLVDIANERYSPIFGTETKNLADAKVKNIADRVGQYFIRLKIGKEAAKNCNIAEKIFGSKIKIQKASFFDQGEEILCGFLTEEQKERDLMEIFKNIDSKLVKSAKFIRVETTDSF